MKRLDIEIMTNLSPGSRNTLPSVRDRWVSVTCLDVSAAPKGLDDCAKGLAIMNPRCEGQGISRVLQGPFSVAEESADMLRGSIADVIDQRTTAAVHMISGDDETEPTPHGMYAQAIRCGACNSRSIEGAIDTIGGALNSESLAGRATNVPEYVVFAHPGRRPLRPRQPNRQEVRFE